MVSGLRRFPYRGYSIYYQIKGEDQVFIVHILNDFMDHRRFF
ncbi:type II toxin-antitoxin system RelE/ParE family toxin [Devosia sp. UYZn731]